MSETLKCKIRAAMENRHIPIVLTAAETAELDNYLRLVGYFSQNIELTGGHA